MPAGLIGTPNYASGRFGSIIDSVKKETEMYLEAGVVRKIICKGCNFSIMVVLLIFLSFKLVLIIVLWQRFFFCKQKIIGTAVCDKRKIFFLVNSTR